MVNHPVNIFNIGMYILAEIFLYVNIINKTDYHTIEIYNWVIVYSYVMRVFLYIIPSTDVLLQRQDQRVIVE